MGLNGKSVWNLRQKNNRKTNLYIAEKIIWKQGAQGINWAWPM